MRYTISLLISFILSALIIPNSQAELRLQGTFHTDSSPHATRLRPPTTPLPSTYYSPKPVYVAPYQYRITFAVPVNSPAQAERTLVLAIKRQRSGISTLIIFEGEGAELSQLRGFPSDGNPFNYLNPPRNINEEDNAPCNNTIPPELAQFDIKIKVNSEPYRQRLNSLFTAHGKLGGQLIRRPCYAKMFSTRIQHLPIEVSPEKNKLLKKQLKLKEGQY